MEKRKKKRDRQNTSIFGKFLDYFFYEKNYLLFMFGCSNYRTAFKFWNIYFILNFFYMKCAWHYNFLHKKKNKK